MEVFSGYIVKIVTFLKTLLMTQAAEIEADVERKPLATVSHVI